MAVKTFLNPEGHHNSIFGSKVMVILLKGRILPIGGADPSRGIGKGLRSMGLPRLVIIQT